MLDVTVARHLDRDILWHIRNLEFGVAKNKHPTALPMPKKLHHTLARGSHGKTGPSIPAMLVLTEASSSSMASRLNLLAHYIYTAPSMPASPSQVISSKLARLHSTITQNPTS
jgi:hypothetical protein